MTELQNAILLKLIKRRAALQSQLDDVLSKPASYSVQGSYSQTSQNAETLRAELARLDAQIKNFRNGGHGLTRIFPDYSVNV